MKKRFSGTFRGFQVAFGLFSCHHCKSLAQAPAEYFTLEEEIKSRNGNREGNSSAENVLKFQVSEE